MATAKKSSLHFGRSGRKVSVERRAGSLDRHVQTLVVIFIAGAVAWSGNATLELKDRVTRLDATVQNLQTSVAGTTVDRWTGTDAKRDREGMQAQIADHEARLRVLENVMRMTRR